MVAPKFLSLDKEYSFFIYLTAYGGHTFYSQEMILIVGCTESIEISDDPNFLEILSLKVEDELTQVYNFYQPKIDGVRAEYC
jgi:hypothetical protein